jgi:hypothetical protein
MKYYLILSHKGICMPMVIAALFIIAKIENQPNYPSMKEWIKKLCDI